MTTASVTVALKMVFKETLCFFIYRDYQEKQAYFPFQLAEPEHLLKYVEIFLDIGHSRVMDLIELLIQQPTQKIDHAQQFASADYTQTLFHDVCKISGITYIL